MARALRVNRSLRTLWFGEYEVAILNLEEEREIEGEFFDAIAGGNVCIIQTGLDTQRLGYNDPNYLEGLLRRNKERIPAAARRAALLLIGVCRSNDFEGMGAFAVCPKDVIKLIAMEVWATRTDPIWIQAL